MPTTRSRLAAMLALVLALGVLAACGDSGDKADGTTAATSGASSGATTADAAGTDATTGGSASSGDSAASVSTEPLPPSDKPVPADAVAIVGDETITKAAFDGLYATAVAQQTTDGGQDAPAAGSKAEDTLKQQVLEYLVRQSELDQEAAKAGLTADAAKVDEQVKTAKETCCQGKDDEWTKYLAERKLTEEMVRDSIAAQEVTQLLYDRITADAKASEEDLKARYEQDKATVYVEPRSRTVIYALFGKPGETPTAANKKRAEKLIADVKAGGDFQKLAVKRTDDESASQTQAQLDVTDEGFDPDFVKAAFALKTGEFTQEPVRSEQFGWFVILAKADTKEERTKPFEEVKAELQTTLDQEAKQKAADTWFAEMQRRYQPLIAVADGYSFPEGSLFAPAGLARAATGTEEPASTADTAATDLPADTADTAATDVPATAATDAASTDAGSTVEEPASTADTAATTG